MLTQIAYLNHDNSIEIILKADDVAVDLSGITDMTLTLGDIMIESDNGDLDPIRWDKAGFATGEVRIYLGDQGVQPDTYENAWLVVYSADYVDGLVWGSFKLTVLAEVEV